jgi:hypothetical protein
MSVSGNRRRSLRDRVLGAVGAAVPAGVRAGLAGVLTGVLTGVLAGVLAACGAAGPGAGTGTARASAPGSCPQAGSPAPGQAGSPTVSGDLYGVAALQAGGVWAVGGTILTDPVAMHSNGSAWTERVLTLNPGHPGNPPGAFQAVAAVSAHDVWAVGVNAGEPLRALGRPGLDAGPQPGDRQAERRDRHLPGQRLGRRMLRALQRHHGPHRTLGRESLDLALCAIPSDPGGHAPSTPITFHTNHRKAVETRPA